MPHRIFAPATTATLLFLTTAAASGQTPDPVGTEQRWSSIKRCAQEDTERARHTCLDRVLRDAGLLTDEMHAQQQRRAFGLENKPAQTPPVAPAAPVARPSIAAGTPPASSATASSAKGEARDRRAAEASRAETARAGAATPPITAAPAPAGSSTVEPAATPPRTSTAPIASAAAQPDRLDVELAKVEKATNGRLFVTTTDGAVWLQIETVEMPLPPVAGDHLSIRKGSLGGYRCTVASTHLTYRCARNR